VKKEEEEEEEEEGSLGIFWVHKAILGFKSILE